MASLADLMNEDRRAKLAREMSHPSPGLASLVDPTAIRTAIDVGMGRMSRDVAYGEKPLSGGLDIAEVGGIPINATDLLGTGIPYKLAMGAKMFAAPLAAAMGVTAIASKASQGAKLNSLANVMRKERGIMAGSNSSNIEDANKLAELIKKHNPLMVPSIEVDKGGSVYLTVKKQKTNKDGSISKRQNVAPIDFKARFADHPSYWGNTISSDPVTNNDIKTMFDMYLHKLEGSQEPVHSVARFDPRDRVGDVADVSFIDAISRRGNPIVKREESYRPFSLFGVKR